MMEEFCLKEFLTNSVIPIIRESSGTYKDNVFKNPFPFLDTFVRVQNEPFHLKRDSIQLSAERQHHRKIMGENI